MRVAHLVDSLNPGGTERQCVELARGLAARGVETIVCYFRSGPLLSEIVRSGVATRAIPTVSLRSIRTPVRLLRFASFIRRWAPDVVQTYGFYTNFPGLLAGPPPAAPEEVADGFTSEARQDQGCAVVGWAAEGPQGRGSSPAVVFLLQGKGRGC